MSRVLRSGVFPNAHYVAATTMPWGAFSNWTKEDRHAVVVYLPHLPAIRHQIPEPDPAAAIEGPGVIERNWGGKNYGVGDQ